MPAAAVGEPKEFETQQITSAASAAVDTAAKAVSEPLRAELLTQAAAVEAITAVQALVALA
jgi:hypothetical protein